MRVRVCVVGVVVVWGDSRQLVLRLTGIIQSNPPLTSTLPHDGRLGRSEGISIC